MTTENVTREQPVRKRWPLWVKILIAQVAVVLCCLGTKLLCENVLPQQYSDEVFQVRFYLADNGYNGMGFLKKDGAIDLLGYIDDQETATSNSLFKASYKVTRKEFYQETIRTIGIDSEETGITANRLMNRFEWKVSPEDPTGRTILIRLTYPDSEKETAEKILMAAGQRLNLIVTNKQVDEADAGKNNRRFNGPPINKPCEVEYQGIVQDKQRTGPNTLLWVIVAGVLCEIVGILICLERGDWKTKLSYVVMGFGNIARGQPLRGILFLLFQIIFLAYMALSGIHWMEQLITLGSVEPELNVPVIRQGLGEQFVAVYGDNSFKALLYGVLTIFFILAFIYTYYQNIRQNHIAEKIIATGKKLKSGGDDLRSLVDDQFHRTLLALPMTGILLFTVLPIIFMILVAFTGYDGAHNGATNNLFHWVGLDNFKTMLSWTSGAGSGSQSYAATFAEILVWTLIWAFFATFTNYFLGMFVAMAINKKGIRLKKVWRTILVLTIAIPQFISLLYVSKMFAYNGVVNDLLEKLGLVTADTHIHFIDDMANPWTARFTVIFINIWIGIPYLMLITTGILMNIPADLYESARIDGASGWQQYTKITLPYMLFVTGPYLLTSFTGNMNNFNVIYLLTGGAPTNSAASGASGNVGFTDLLITWLFKITTGPNSKFYLASVVGILVFVVVAVITLVVYRLLPSIKNEEDFQ